MGLQIVGLADGTCNLICIFSGLPLCSSLLSPHVQLLLACAKRTRNIPVSRDDTKRIHDGIVSLKKKNLGKVLVSRPIGLRLSATIILMTHI